MKKTLFAAVCGLLSLFAFAASQIDILVAYDQSASAWLQANSLTASGHAAAVVDKLNTFLPATKLDQSFTFRLAGSFQSAAAAAGVDPAERLVNAITSVANGTTGKASGQWKDIQTARDNCAADIVVVLVDAPPDSPGVMTAGVSWQLGSEKIGNIKSFAPFAYAACAVDTATTTHLVMHEIGHIMGAGHSDLLVEDPGPGFRPYASALHFIDGDGKKRFTVMGYPYLTASDTGYKIYPAFSSSEYTTEDGVALGDANHDNTRTLRENCAAVAAFRESGGGSDIEPAPPIVPAPPVVTTGAFKAKVEASAKVVDQGKIAGIVKVTVAKTDKKGTSKVTAAYYGLDGKKVAAKAVKTGVGIEGGVSQVKDVSLVLKNKPQMVVTVGEDGSISGMLGSAKLEAVASTAVPYGTATFSVDPAFSLGVAGELHDYEGVELVPFGGEAVAVNGKSWKCLAAAAPKLVKDKATGEYRLTGLDNAAKPNLSGLKLSYAVKTGVFKGSFKVYAVADSGDKKKLKKYTVNVSGVVVDGVGYGQATCKKPAAGPWAVTVK